LGNVQVSCNGATDGAIDVFTAGGTLPYSFAWTDGDTTEDRSNLAAGSYQMTVTDAQGCFVTINEVLAEPAAMTLTSVATTLDCYDADDAEVTYTVGGGTQPYYSAWTGSAGQNPDSVYVTFQVDMQSATINTGGIQLISNGGIVANMDTMAVLEDGIYRVTVAVVPGTTIQYRFFNGSNAESVPSGCGVNVSGTIYRTFTVNSDTTVGARVFAGCAQVSANASGAMISGGRQLIGLEGGVVVMSYTDVNGCSVSVTDTIVRPDSLYIASYTVLNASCPQNFDGIVEVVAAGGVGNYSYAWSNGGTNDTIVGNYGTYDLILTDGNGCVDSSSYLIDAPFPYNDEEVCMVTVDTTGVNLVVWEKTPMVGTAEYIILRENASTQYVSVGSNVYNDMSTWSDQNSNPAVQPYRYKLVVMDSCGNYSDTSDYHATIHLQASQGVASNEVQLQWTAYEGKQVQTYYIYRWLSPTTRILIDSVSANVQTYTDIYPINTAITALLYEVGAKFVNGGCSPTTGKNSAIASTMSNRLDWGQDGGLPIGTDEWVNVVLNSQMELFPNPTQNILNVALSGAWEEERNVTMQVLDYTGRVISVRRVDGAGTVRFDFTELPAGVYFLHTMTEDGRIFVKRFERIN
jgi:hypothetical protein